MTTQSSAPSGTDAPERRLAKTIVYVHGIGNKPPPEVLKLHSAGNEGIVDVPGWAR